MCSDVPSFRVFRVFRVFCGFMSVRRKLTIMNAPLSPCDYRYPQAPEGDYFFCRHQRVYAAGHIVDRRVCQCCTQRGTTGMAPRELPAGARLPLRRG